MDVSKIVIACLLVLLVSVAQADVRLPAVIGNNMVMQQQAKAAIWGWAEPGEKINVKASWQLQSSKSTKADKDGNWKVFRQSLQCANRKAGSNCNESSCFQGRHRT